MEIVSIERKTFEELVAKFDRFVCRMDAICHRHGENKDNEWIIHFMGSLDRLLDNVEHLTASYRPTLNGERFFTDKEVSARLKVSRRTLQDYRNEGRIAYIQLGGKILYRESDIERMLTDSYRTAYRQTAI